MTNEELKKEWEEFSLTVSADFISKGYGANEEVFTWWLEKMQEREKCEKCGKLLSDGSICGVHKDCHLHDWRQKDVLASLLTDIEGREIDYPNPAKGQRLLFPEQIQGYNAAIKDILFLISSKLQ